jgi:hypothetical protein
MGVKCKEKKNSGELLVVAEQTGARPRLKSQLCDRKVSQFLRSRWHSPVLEREKKLNMSSSTMVKNRSLQRPQRVGLNISNSSQGNGMREKQLERLVNKHKTQSNLKTLQMAGKAKPTSLVPPGQFLHQLKQKNSVSGQMYKFINTSHRSKQAKLMNKELNYTHFKMPG